MSMRYFGHVALGCLGIACALLGAWTTFQEGAPNLRGGNTAIARISAMPDGSAPIGVTMLTRIQSLMDCELVGRSARSLEASYLGAEKQAAVEQRCDELSAVAANLNPTDSLAWLVHGSIGGLAGNAEQLNTSLQKSYATGKAEGWLAAIRVPIAESYFDSLDTANRAAHDRDIELVASSPVLARTVVRQYLINPAARARITAILEGMPPEGQQNFVFALRNTLAEVL